MKDNFLEIIVGSLVLLFAGVFVIFSISITGYQQKGNIFNAEFGNQYYERRNKHKNTLKRMVKYKGIDEASKIPSRYHGWLHYYSDEFPSNQSHNFQWQKKHLPNLT